MSWRAATMGAAALAAFAAFVGYFSAQPPYRPLAGDRAVVKLALSHAGQRKQDCRMRSPEELARLAPNMRAALDCPRERADVRIELDMDGRAIVRAVAPPAGLRRDLPSTVYRRIEVPAGRHLFKARLADGDDGLFGHSAEKAVELAPGAILVVDFVASRGGFLFNERP